MIRDAQPLLRTDELETFLGFPQQVGSLILDEQEPGEVTWHNYGGSLDIAFLQYTGTFDPRFPFLKIGDVILQTRLFPDHGGNMRQNTDSVNDHDLLLEGLIKEMRDISALSEANIWLIYIGYPELASHLRIVFARNSLKEINHLALSGANVPQLIEHIVKGLNKSANFPIEMFDQEDDPIGICGSSERTFFPGHIPVFTPHVIATKLNG